jgi:hypothetical protein
VREPGGLIIAVRLQVKGGSFRDLLRDSASERTQFLMRFKDIPMGSTTKINVSEIIENSRPGIFQVGIGVLCAAC